MAALQPRHKGRPMKSSETLLRSQPFALSSRAAAIAADLPTRLLTKSAGFIQATQRQMRVLLWRRRRRQMQASVNGAVGGRADRAGRYRCGILRIHLPLRRPNAFWFTEIQGGISGLNGSQPTVSRFPVPASSLNALASDRPSMPCLDQLVLGQQVSAPSPALDPASSRGHYRPVPANAYLFGGVVEQDIGAQIGALSWSGHQWVVAPIIGLGALLTRASNNVMIDTWAGWQMNSNSFCSRWSARPCARRAWASMARVGVSLLSIDFYSGDLAQELFSGPLGTPHGYYAAALSEMVRGCGNRRVTCEHGCETLYPFGTTLSTLPAAIPLSTALIFTVSSAMFVGRRPMKSGLAI